MGGMKVKWSYIYKSNSLTVQNFTTGGEEVRGKRYVWEAGMKEKGGLSEGGEERGWRGEKEEKCTEGEDEKRVEGVGDQDKMENSTSVDLGNRTMEKEVERKTERQR